MPPQVIQQDKKFSSLGAAVRSTVGMKLQMYLQATNSDKQTILTEASAIFL
jgi:hypothetical protein